MEETNKVEEKNIFSPKEYRKLIGKEKEVVIPSGAKFILKRLTVEDYLSEDLKEFNKEFSEYIENLKQGKELDKKDEKTLLFFEKIIKLVLDKGIVSPKVQLDLTNGSKIDDVLLFSELSSEDQKFIFNYIVGK